MGSITTNSCAASITVDGGTDAAAIKNEAFSLYSRTDFFYIKAVRIELLALRWLIDLILPIKKL